MAKQSSTKLGRIKKWDRLDSTSINLLHPTQKWNPRKSVPVNSLQERINRPLPVFHRRHFSRTHVGCLEIVNNLILLSSNRQHGVVCAPLEKTERSRWRSLRGHPVRWQSQRVYVSYVHSTQCGHSVSQPRGFFMSDSLVSFPDPTAALRTLRSFGKGLERRLWLAWLLPSPHWMAGQLLEFGLYNSLKFVYA